MPDGLAALVLQPAFVLSVLVGAFNTCIYIFVRGKLGWHVPALLIGAILGALIGQAIGARVGDLLRIGDYSLVWATLVAWLGIGMAIVLTGLAASKSEPPSSGGQVRPRGG